MQTCVIEDCERESGLPGTARGLCRAHYRRWQRYGDAQEPERRAYRGSGCKVDGCDGKYAAKDLCEKHYARQRRTGSSAGPAACRPQPACYCGRRVYGLGLCRPHYDAKRGSRPGGTPEAARLRAKARRARKAGASGSHTEDEWLAVLAEFNGGCAYCPDLAATKDHVVPLASGGSHDISNIVPACRSCNSSKNDRLLIAWAGGNRWHG